MTYQMGRKCGDIDKKAVLGVSHECGKPSNVQRANTDSCTNKINRTETTLFLSKIVFQNRADICRLLDFLGKVSELY